MTIGLGHYLTVAAILFTLGIFGIFLNRKNVIVILMSIELILLAVNINLVAFSAFLGDLVGQVFALFVLTVAAAEPRSGLPSSSSSSATAARSRSKTQHDEGLSGDVSGHRLPAARSAPIFGGCFGRSLARQARRDTSLRRCFCSSRRLCHGSPSSAWLRRRGLSRARCSLIISGDSRPTGRFASTR